MVGIIVFCFCSVFCILITNTFQASGWHSNTREYPQFFVARVLLQTANVQCMNYILSIKAGSFAQIYIKRGEKYICSSLSLRMRSKKPDGMISWLPSAGNRLRLQAMTKVALLFGGEAISVEKLCDPSNHKKCVPPFCLPSLLSSSSSSLSSSSRAAAPTPALQPTQCDKKQSRCSWLVVLLTVLVCILVCGSVCSGAIEGQQVPAIKVLVGLFLSTTAAPCS